MSVPYLIFILDLIQLNNKIEANKGLELEFSGLFYNFKDICGDCYNGFHIDPSAFVFWFLVILPLLNSLIVGYFIKQQVFSSFFYEIEELSNKIYLSVSMFHCIGMAIIMALLHQISILQPNNVVGSIIITFILFLIQYDFCYFLGRKVVDSAKGSVLLSSVLLFINFVVVIIIHRQDLCF